jgi:hypothetical protein
MLRGPLGKPGFRGQFSGHETFPLRHLWLRKAFDAVCGAKPPRRNLFTDPEAIITFGVGKNMVTSIRHWALTCSIIEESGEIYQPTTLGKFLFNYESGRDAFMESPATTWLIQWLVAGSAARSTTWFFAFNHLTAPTFDREAVARPVRELCAERGWRTSAATIRRDVECFIRSYVRHQEARPTDDALEPVLAELGLIRSAGGRHFEFHRGPKPSLPDGVFLYALEDFWWPASSRKRWPPSVGICNPAALNSRLDGLLTGSVSCRGDGEMRKCRRQTRSASCFQRRASTGLRSVSSTTSERKRATLAN